MNKYGTPEYWDINGTTITYFNFRSVLAFRLKYARKMKAKKLEIVLSGECDDKITKFVPNFENEKVFKINIFFIKINQ